MLVLLLVKCLLITGFVWAGDLSVVTDDEIIRLHGPGSAKESVSTVETRPSRNPDSTLHQPAEDEKGDQTLQQKQEELRIIQYPLETEQRLMADVIQPLERESASKWLAGFISSKPLSCPLRQQRQWIEAILWAVERNELPICKEILGLVASIISLESGFHVDPLAVDPSRHESIKDMIRRAEEKLYQKYGSLLMIPPVPKLYASYKDNYYPKLVTCSTEGEVEVVARSIAEDLKRDATRLPTIIRSVIDREIEKVSNVVRTKGSMQLNFIRACKVMKDRGEQFTDQELCDYMYTINGGVDVGVAALKPMFVQYAARYAAEGDMSWLFLVGMDYHYGPFSSRNMMEQIRIRDLSERKIALDGDFLHYDDRGRPEARDSETLLAAVSGLPSKPKKAIFKAFLLEKDPHYIYTDVHKAIVAAHMKGFGKTPFAVIGELKMGENAEIKHGVTWSTNAYLKKLDSCLNSIPWDE